MSIKGKKILITRPIGQFEAWARQLEALGAVAISFPLIEIVSAEDTPQLVSAFSNIWKFDWIILPSANAVKYFFLKAVQYKIQKINSLFAVTGPKTGKILEEYGYNASFIPGTFTGESLAENILEIKDKSILVAETDISDGRMRQILEHRGARVTEIPVYQTKIVTGKQDELQYVINEQKIDIITFASPSAVEAFVKMNIDKKNAVLACIGPVTAEKFNEYGIKPDIIAESYTTEGLTEAMEKRFEDFLPVGRQGGFEN
jgi:uroporphyrinogen-III synthase